ncbi:LrgB [Cohnella kolymensis]|uniref:LrgB n=1 Tax=Cohnella kolymensis TaxID=1590652 RepID=A0ABR5A3I5_9BACL|nr:LrgB family protein [Cohnella kolymensis]KIL35512.1 LrgB [Cohnella kolymensis]
MPGVEEFYRQPLFGIAITVMLYAAALRLNKRLNWLNPLLVAAGGLIVLLLICDIPYEDYKVGGDVVTFFLGPATVALAVPLYKSARKMKGRLRAIVLGSVIGCITGLLSACLLVWSLHGSRDILLSMLPKSVTSPVAIEVARQIGGIPELGGVFAVLTGLFGSIAGPWLLNKTGVHSDIAIGTSMGTAAHGIGTARILRDSELQGGISGFAMGLSCIITPILCIPIYFLR